MKKIIFIISFLITSVANAGFVQSKMFNPTVGCVIGGAAGYMKDTSSENAMRDGAILCGAGALLGYAITSYYEDKYGMQFRDAKSFQHEKLKQNKIRKKQQYSKIKNPYVRRVKRVIPAQKLSTGDIILPRVEEDIQIKNIYDRIGD